MKWQVILIKRKVVCLCPVAYWFPMLLFVQETYSKMHG